MTLPMATISWRRVHDSGDEYYENVGSKEYHQLLVNHSMTGLLEITVTFSSSVCEKSSSVEYTGESFYKV